MKIGNIIDIIVVLVFVISAVTGLKKGLMRMFLGIMSFVIAGIAVMMLSAPVTDYMMQTEIPNMVHSHVEPVISSVFDHEKGTVTAEDALKNAGIPKFAISYISQNTDVQKLETTFVETLSSSATSGIVKIFSTLLIFVGIHILLTIIIWSCDKLFSHTLLGSFNRMLGATIGVANAMIVVYMLCGAVMLLSPILDMSTVTDIIEQTFITKCFYNNNILMNIFC